MGKFKKVLCTCEVCNKPFSAIFAKPLCKQCEEKKKLSDSGIAIRSRAVRNADDKFELFMDRIRAFDHKASALRSRTRNFHSDGS